MTEAVGHDVDHDLHRILSDDSLGVRVGFAIDPTEDVIGGVKNDQTIVHEDTVKLRLVQRGIIRLAIGVYCTWSTGTQPWAKMGCDGGSSINSAPGRRA